MATDERPPGDRYLIERILGEGGQAIVYEVTDPLTGRRLALKRIKPERMTSSVKAAMAREFQVLTRLRHPNLVEVYDFHAEPTGTFTMEVVDGRDLREAELDADELIEAVVQVCRALEYVHARGLVHLDVKPSNILIVRRGGGLAVKLMDFGVASTQRAATPSGYTLGFVAPEVVEGRALDGRADLYSLGMTLLALRERVKPSGSDATVRVREPGTAPALPVDASHLPPALRGVAERLIRPEPSERFGSAAQVIEAIAAACGRDIAIETPATRVGWVGSARLSGRDDELALLGARWDEVREGAGRHVALVGAAGLGKSRLVAELRVQVQLGGGLVALTTATPEAPSYHAVAQLVGQLRRVHGGEGGLEPAQRAELARLRVDAGMDRGAAGAGADLHSSAARSRLSEAIVALTAALARNRPLLVAVEDVQWLDPASRTLLELLSARLSAGELPGVLLITTAREAEAAPAPETLVLAPLAEEAVRALVEDVVGVGVVPDELFAQTAELSGGNGFFITELLKLLVDRELVVRRGEGWAVDPVGLAALELPADGASLVAARLALLPPALRRLLGLVALLGASVEPGVLEEVHGESVVADLADLAGRQFLVAEGQRFRFAHAEIAAGALADTHRDADRAGACRRLAEALATRAGHPAEVARLYLEAGEPEAALPHLLRAGARAEAVYDHAAAVAAYDRALGIAAARDVHDLMRRRLRAIRLGGLGLVDPRAEEALAAAHSAAERAAVRIDLARIDVQRGRYAEAVAHAAEAGPAGARARADAMWVTGLARYHEGALAAALAALGEAVAAYADLGDGAGHAAVLNDRGLVHGYAGDFTAALGDHQRALELLEALPGHPGSLDALAATANNLGFAAWNLGRYAEARVQLDRALALRRRLADLHGEGVTRNNLGNVLRHQGDLDGARAEYHATIDLSRRSGNVLYEAIAWNNLGQIEEEEGRPAAAIASYERALGLARGVGDKIREADNLGSLGICRYFLGEPAAAVTLLGESVAQRRAIGDWAYLVLDLSFLAAAELALGRREAARAAIEEALADLAAGQEGIEQVQAVHLNAHDVLLALGDEERAVASLRQAVAALGVGLATLPSSAARQAFLEKIRINRAIADRARRAGLAVPA